MKILEFFVDACFFSGITALRAFNRNAKGVSGVPFWYKGVNGVLLESKRHYTGKIAAYSQKSSTREDLRQNENLGLLVRILDFLDVSPKIKINNGQIFSIY